MSYEQPHDPPSRPGAQAPRQQLIRRGVSSPVEAAEREEAHTPPDTVSPTPPDTYKMVDGTALGEGASTSISGSEPTVRRARVVRLRDGDGSQWLLQLVLYDDTKLEWEVNSSVINQLQLRNVKQVMQEARDEAFARSTAVGLLAEKMGISMDGANQVVRAAVEERRDADREAGTRRRR